DSAHVIARNHVAATGVVSTDDVVSGIIHNDTPERIADVALTISRYPNQVTGNRIRLVAGAEDPYSRSVVTGNHISRRRGRSADRIVGGSTGDVDTVRPVHRSIASVSQRSDEITLDDIAACSL